jgi:putative glycosyltransferase (TIGR04372 family)
VRLLNLAGYQVLLTGDFAIGAAVRRDFGSGFVDARSLGVARDLYLLFAASEADIFIGNHGGGEVVARINDIPSLYLDWFPYSHGRKNAWVYFKSACDGEGRIYSGRRLITEFVYDTKASFGTLLNNTEEEITEAVASFIEDVTHLDRPDPYANVAALIPRDTQFFLTGARISPAWVRRNIMDDGKTENATA